MLNYGAWAQAGHSWHRALDGSTEQAVAADGPLHGPPLNRSVRPTVIALMLSEASIREKMLLANHNVVGAKPRC